MAVKMPCCGRAAVPKTSKLGNFFFAHAARGDCSSAPESQDHIFLKSLIARAAKRADWAVVTEWPGSTPSGERWVADVFCQKGAIKVAIEVQLSYQTAEELERRNLNYRESGVRAAWIVSGEKFKDGYLTTCEKIPLFRLKQFSDDGEPVVSEFDVLLSEFTVGILSKRLKWKKTPWEYDIHYFEDQCWKCKGKVKQVYGYAIDVYGDTIKTIPNASTVLEGMKKFITNEELRNLGLNTIERFDNFKGKTVKFPYCNACIHCGAPQYNYYLLSRLEEYQRTDSPLIGNAVFVSDREFSGEWRFLRGLASFDF
ncbi:competence protein CoiA family protein [Cupriavidus sp. YAF13]|uniref:competence protein CoiA family protein n=1 Tax=Cupriavidus sp. YAF13 TaxID=3233075 RepID=UPI003F93DAA4